MRNPRITQVFGARPDYYRQFGLPGHEGIDFGVITGTPVLAAAEGFVYLIAEDGGKSPSQFPYGNQVRIAHENGDYMTVYAHLSHIDCTLGQRIAAGTQIGLSGNTGNSSGPHLHLTLKKKGATAAGETRYPNDIVDPTPYLS